MSSGLTGTMSGMDVQTQYEALQKELAAKAAQEREAANQQAQQALMGYQQAAAAPQPQLSPADVFVPTLLSNIASVLSQDPGYRQRAQEDIRMQRSDLMKMRVENLQALRDNYLQKAKAAEDAGDSAEAEAARLKVEQLAKTSTQLMEQQKQLGAQSLEDKRQANRMTLAQEAGRQARLTNAAKPATGVAGLAGNAGDFPIHTTTTGRQWRKITGLTGNMKNAVIVDSAQKGIPALSGADATALDEIQIARLNQQKIRAQIEGLLPSDWKQRPAAIANIRVGQFLQSNKLAAAFGAWREMAIQQLKASAAVTGNRQVQKQFELVLQNDIPQLTDTMPVALARMDIVDQMLGSREDTLLQSDLSKLIQNAQSDSTAAPAGVIKFVRKNGKLVRQQ